MMTIFLTVLTLAIFSAGVIAAAILVISAMMKLLDVLAPEEELHDPVQASINRNSELRRLYVDEEPFPHYNSTYWEHLNAAGGSSDRARSLPTPESDTAQRPMQPEESDPEKATLKVALRASDHERSAEFSQACSSQDPSCQADDLL